MIAAIRSYDQIRTIESGSRSLERIVQGASDLFARRGLDNLCDAILTHSCRLLGNLADGFVCVPNHTAIDGNLLDELRIVAAAGTYRKFIGKSLSDMHDSKAVSAVHDTLGGGANRYAARSVTLLLRDSSHASLVVHLHSHAPLAELDRRLVEVFCANGSVAFENVRLFERLRNHAYTDQLTGLANRTRFVNCVDERIVAGRDSWVVGIIDIDQFSEINDALGHGCGDQLLKAIGARLGRSLGAVVTLARVAGDSFAVLGPPDEIDPKKLLALFAKPHKVGAYSLHVSVSIGLVRLNETRGSGLDALKNASIGLNRAKSRKQGSYCFFTHAMEAETQERVKLALGLRRSIRAQQLLLHYQPQIELATGRVLGAEALLRWRNKDGSFVPPEKFIPVAESSGLIRPIGVWVLRTAARQLRSWCDRWPGEFRLAVNVSIDQFRIPDFDEQVCSVIDEFGLEPRRLELEITESIAMDDMEIVLGTLRKLKNVGVGIAIDDFGTGFSSLGYLQKLSVDRLKIDRSFVNGMNVSAGGGAGAAEHRVSCIPEMIIKLGHNLNLQVVAEGVETEEQARLLREFGCDEAQGYLYSRPLAADALEQWIDARGISGQSGTGHDANAT
jgi:diguanylate cyclase (GGDEF)-like protein